MMCELRAATHDYERAGRSMQVCERCRDRQELQDAYEDQLQNIHALAGRGGIDQALALLDELLATHGAQDHDGWLRRTVWSERGMLLADAGRFEEALAIYAERSRLGFVDSSDEMVHQLGLANALEKLGRTSEALGALATGLDRVDEKSKPGALTLLGRLAEIAGDQAETELEGRKALLLSTATAWGIEVPSSNPPERASLVKTLRAALTALATAQAHYDELRRRVSGLSLEQKRPLLEAFIANERVGFYRDRAKEMLDRNYGMREY
jgi:tetratricopeptide (TPR) repeat protein